MKKAPVTCAIDISTDGMGWTLMRQQVPPPAPHAVRDVFFLKGSGIPGNTFLRHPP